MTILIIATAALAAALVIAITALLRAQRQGAADRDRLHQAELRAATADALLKSSMADAEKRLDEARRFAAEQLEHERQTTGERFKALAADVLRLTSHQLDERSRASLETVLAPVRTSLEAFTKDFKDAYSVENTERLSLRESIRTLAQLNQRVSEETSRLTQALRGDNRWQGRWGEMVLQNILEASGLEQGRCMMLQKGTTDEEGDQLRPDAIINCPDNRRLLIDSKVTLTAFLRLTQAATEAERAECLKAHVRAVESRVKDLSSKDYTRRMGAEAADFVLMFIPHEAAYIACMDAKPDMWMHAFDNKVIIASPTHLVTLIKLVEQMWANSDRNANAAVIADEAGKLLDKLNGFLKDLGNVADALGKAQKCFDDAMQKLSTGRGNVLGRADRMRRLGAKAGPLPERYLRELDTEGDTAEA